MAHVDTRVISEIQGRLERDHDAFKRVLQSFGISKTPLRLRNFFGFFQLFPDTPVKMLKDVFEALQLYDLLELLEIQSAIKPHRSLQLAYTLDEIKKLNGVSDLPTTYHSCGAVLIITDDEEVSGASAIKTLFTDLVNKSDVTEILRTREIPTLRHLNEEINVMILEIENLLAGKNQRATVTSLFDLAKLKPALDELKWSLLITRGGGDITFRLNQLMSGISKVSMELKQISFRSPSEGETQSFSQSMIVTAERIQENLTQLMQRSPEWFVIEEEKEKKNYHEIVSAVINRWIHRQG